MSDKLIIRVDASAVKESACMLRFYRTVIDGYRAPVPSNDMLFGSAFHEYIAEMERSGGNYGAATKAAKDIFALPCTIKPSKKYMTETYLLKLCMSYWEEYLVNNDFVTVRDEDNKPLVELKFAWPYYSDDQVEVMLCGTIDRIAKHKRGTYAIPDYKTTSVGNAADYLEGYWLSPQLMFYRLVLRYYAEAYPQSIFAEINRLTVGCFVDAIFLRGATKDAEFIRSEVMIFPDKQMLDFELLLQRQIASLVQYVKSGTKPIREGMINGACETKYGHCPFFVACKAPDEIAEQHILRRNFIQKQYNPLDFNA